MAIALRGTRILSQAGGTTDVTTTLNAGFGNEAGSLVTLQAGDFVIFGVLTGSTADRTLSTSSSGWTKLTELYADGSTTDTNLAVWYKTIDASDVTNGFVLSGGSGNANDACIRMAIALTGVDSSTPLDVAEVPATGTASSCPNPGSITPSTAGAWVVAIGGGASGATSVFTNPGSYSSTTNNFRTLAQADTNDGAGLVAIHTKSWASGAVDPAQVTGGTSNAGDSWAVYTLAIRPAGTAAQNLDPSLYTNTQTFHGPTITVGAVSLAPSLYTNSQTFHAPTVSATYALTPSLFTNSQTFHAPTVTTGAVSLTPSLFTNTQAFYGPAITVGAVTLSPSLLSNAQTFYSPTVARDGLLEPALFTNNQTFFVAALVTNQALVAPLTTNAQSFFAATLLATYTVAPPLLTNRQRFKRPLVGTAIEYEPGTPLGWRAQNKTGSWSGTGHDGGGSWAGTDKTSNWSGGTGNDGGAAWIKATRNTTNW